MMRIGVGVFLCSWWLVFVCLGADEADAITGVWVTGEGKARVEIVRQGEQYEGRIVWLREPNYPSDDEEAGKPKHDRYNPDPKLRSRPIIGLRILEGFRYEGNRTWAGGSVYDPESGNTYRGKIRLDGEGNLVLRGYVGITLLGRTEVWQRYQGESEEANSETTKEP